ncbi:MAG: DUF871 domain-containing protein [Erysipelotrichaceae bacterium]|nr:DUF871 domain-containing protein [Erysipelotrichaceae bacterium]
MKRLGISIYPEHSTLEKDLAYIDLAGKYGFKRVFSCLLSVDKPKEEIKKEFAAIMYKAHEYGMEVIFDVSPAVFDKLGISTDDLSFFEDIQADGIRLDEAFDGMKEAAMTYNPQNLIIEMNASAPNKALDNICSYHPKMSKLQTCHNFYPQRYTGLSYDLFKKLSARIQKLGLPVAAFVSSQQPDTYGPWPVNEGLSTLEIHRDLPAETAARHLFATGLVDDVLVANCYASEEELAALAALDPDVLTFRIELEKELTDVEEAILYDYSHVVRGDFSDYMARSTMPRITYASSSIPAANTHDLKRGDVVILNDGYDRYKGELHIVLKDMPNDGRKNVIGHLPKADHLLLEFIEPHIPFKFIR